MVHTSFGGDWTRQKLEILGRYLDAYTTALKDRPFRLIYVDAFAGEGVWRPPEDYEDFQTVVDGSARIALDVQDKPFDRLLFIEKDPERFASLRQLAVEFPNRNIQVINNDANTAIPDFCRGMNVSDRAVVFLDPFATEVSWQTVEALALTKKIDCWILFPLSATARIMPRGDEPPPAWSARLDWVFGGREYWEDFYSPSPQLSLFGDDPAQERSGGSDLIAERYRRRLETVFTRVAPTSRTLTNSKNSPMFELFFAASNPVGASVAIRIADHILRHW